MRSIIEHGRNKYAYQEEKCEQTGTALGPIRQLWSPVSAIDISRRFDATMDNPVHPSDSSDHSTPGGLDESVQLWFVISVIGLFILGLFCTLKVAADLFLPI